MLSVAFFSFIDPVIAKARRVSHLPAAELPPQCDYDYAEELNAEAYPVSGVNPRLLSSHTALLTSASKDMMNEVVNSVGYQSQMGLRAWQAQREEESRCII